MIVAQIHEPGIQLSKEQLAVLADTRERVDSGPENLLMIVEKQLVLEMIVDESLEMIKDESYEMIMMNHEKLMLAKAQEAGQILDEEQLASLTDPGIDEAPVAQLIIPQNSAFQTEDLDAYDSVVMIYPRLKRNEKFAAFQQEIDTLKETLSNNVKEKESLSKNLTVFKTESKEKESEYIDNEIILEKQNKELENIIFKMYRSTQAMHMLTKPQVFYDDTHKQALGYQKQFHLKAHRIKPTLYDGSVIAKNML
nr:hypothetical protein [Tanacetum cinerariifolium]